ncbi:hypothetical protein KW537_12820 [Vibrio fluvialis]|nr:hypothetical protein [Vibrio fluvialis]
MSNKKDTDVIKVKPNLSVKGHYGMLGDFMKKLSEGTEVIPEFLGAEVLSYLSCSIKRDQVSTKFGATKTVPRCNAILVADSGSGKGLSAKQFDAVKSHVNDITNLCPQHNGGLSTTEGLVNAIRDDTEDENGNIIHGVSDKRLFISEEEFVNVINRSQKGNSTLSSTIRCLFDGGEIQPLTKYNQVGCKYPHVVLLGHITPVEIIEKINLVEISNGFLNRFPIFLGFKQPDQPFPKCIGKDDLKNMAERLEEVIGWCNSQKREYFYTEQYRKLWVENYSRLRNIGAKDSIEGTLLARVRHYTSMYAMLFAAMDLTNEIDAKHLEAALAWIDYWHQSVTYLYNTELQSAKDEERLLVAREVYKGIVKSIKSNGGKPIGKTPLTKLFSGRFSAEQISDSLKFMQELARPPIVVTLLPRNKHEISLIK